MKRVKNAGCRCFSIPVNIGLIRLMLLIRCPENAAIIKQTLEGNDIWAHHLAQHPQGIIQRLFLNSHFYLHELILQ